MGHHSGPRRVAPYIITEIITEDAGNILELLRSPDIESSKKNRSMDSQIFLNLVLVGR